MRVLAGEHVPDAGELVLGPRVSPGFFTQLNARTDFARPTSCDLVTRADRRHGEVR